jgi:hypothetical protein
MCCDIPQTFHHWWLSILLALVLRGTQTLRYDIKQGFHIKINHHSSRRTTPRRLTGGAHQNLARRPLAMPTFALSPCPKVPHHLTSIRLRARLQSTSSIRAPLGDVESRTLRASL